MAFFMLDAGTSTVACLALFALRIRVSISAMGSVMCMSLTSYSDYRQAGTDGKVSGIRLVPDLLTASAPFGRIYQNRPQAELTTTGGRLGRPRAHSSAKPRSRGLRPADYGFRTPESVGNSFLRP